MCDVRGGLQDSNEAVANAVNVTEDGLERKIKNPVMVSFVLLSWNLSGRTVLFHEEITTIDVANEKLQSSLFNTCKTK